MHFSLDALCAVERNLFTHGYRAVGTGSQQQGCPWHTLSGKPIVSQVVADQDFEQQAERGGEQEITPVGRL